MLFHEVNLFGFVNILKAVHILIWKTLPLSVLTSREMTVLNKKLQYYRQKIVDVLYSKIPKTTLYSQTVNYCLFLSTSIYATRIKLLTFWPCFLFTYFCDFHSCQLCGPTSNPKVCQVISNPDICYQIIALKICQLFFHCFY